LAATVAAFTVGTVAVQAQPGGPFYSLKLAIETANLPSVEAPAGWDARIGRLQRRIDESVAAGRSGNSGAVTSGLGEYRAELAALNSELIDPVRRSGLTAVVSRDLAIVVDLETAYPSELVRLLVADMQALVGWTDPNSGDAETSDRPTDDRRAYDAIGNSRGGGDRHAGDAIRDRHHEDAMGNPHVAGETRKPSAARSTGNPHVAGETGKPDAGGGSSPSDPHDEGSTGNPHDGSGANPDAGNPHDGGSGANRHADGKRSPKANRVASKD
jgi:hypothetical protein